MLPARKEALNRLETALEKFPPLLERSFITCGNEDKVADRKTSEFRVMQWNVLADGTNLKFILSYLFVILVLEIRIPSTISLAAMNLL